MSNSPQSKEVKVDGRLISYMYREGCKPPVVFIHGYGASKETFLEAFEYMELQSFTILATDLVGFGDSDKTPDFSYLMKDQAEVLGKAIDLLGIDGFHVVAHSMGGIIGIELGEMIPDRIFSLINAEGNITAEDCTMSKRVEEMGEEYFRQEGLEKLKHSIAEESKRTRDAQARSLRDYLKSLSKATPKSLYKSSISTVHESYFGDLLKRFARLPFYKCYIYGEKNKDVFPTEEKLKKEGIPLFYVSKSGHAMMKENPDEFYSIVFSIISRYTHERKSTL